MGAILIFSKMGEVTTCDVIDWLDAFKVDFFRINEGELDKMPSSFQLTNEGQSATVESTKGKFKLEDIDTVWFRKTKPSKTPDTSTISDPDIAALIEAHTFNELEAYNLTFHQLLEKKWLNHPTRKEINKPFQLRMAQKVGFKIPATLVTNEKTILCNFKKNYSELIVKAIFRSRGFMIDEVFHAGFTTILTEETIHQLPDTFFPILVQQQIDKEYEIRTFYLDGECHSMAIFSQMDEQTVVDFRRYNRTKPNRTVPFSLPESITNQVKTFMDNMELNSGSLDFIRGKDGHYYFLEVNPTGQFGMVSKPCNYCLEKKVAEWLIQ
ncbi:MAG: grasp-with-spasm system ATP-grasp peptide maturase [Chitinophagales bacterium]